MTRFFSFFDLSGKLGSVFEIFQNTLKFSDAYKPLDRSWFTVSIKPPRLMLLQNGGGCQDTVKDRDLSLKDEHRDNHSREDLQTTILEEDILETMHNVMPEVGALFLPSFVIIQTNIWLDSLE
jgi:hypothetical protein